MMFSRYRIVGVVLLLLMVSIFPITTQQPTPTKTAKFVIAGWGFPSDEYGQGIDKVGLFENSTGSWFPLETIDYDESSESEIYTNASIKIEVWTWQNSTLTGAINWTEGKKYQRHSVSVITSNGTLVFSQQNFTYAYCFPAIDPPLWYYAYDVVLNFVPIEGEIYTTTIDYDVYHPDTETEYLHDGSSLSGITNIGHGGLDEGEYGIASNGSVIEFWIMPDAVMSEGVHYKLDFTDFNNTGDMNLTVRYRIEGATNRFYYVMVYGDVSNDGSGDGKSTSWANLEITLDDYKMLDYIQLSNFDDPASTASGNLSVWIDYIEIFHFYTDWQDVAEMVLYLQVPYDMWGYNSALIILGLVMIPTSTLYLAYGIRNDRSSNRLFYGLLVFMLGCGLLIGGIMP